MKKLILITVVLLTSIGSASAHIDQSCKTPFEKSLSFYSEGRVYVEEAEIVRNDYRKVGNTEVLCKMHQITKGMLNRSIIKFNRCISHSSDAYLSCDGDNSIQAKKNKKHCSLNVKLARESLAKTQTFLTDYCKYDYELKAH